MVRLARQKIYKRQLNAWDRIFITNFMQGILLYADKKYNIRHTIAASFSCRNCLKKRCKSRQR